MKGYKLRDTCVIQESICQKRMMRTYNMLCTMTIKLWAPRLLKSAKAELEAAQLRRYAALTSADGSGRCSKRNETHWQQTCGYAEHCRAGGGRAGGDSGQENEADTGAGRRGGACRDVRKSWKGGRSRRRTGCCTRGWSSGLGRNGGISCRGSRVRCVERPSIRMRTSRWTTRG